MYVFKACMSVRFCDTLIQDTLNVKYPFSSWIFFVLVGFTALQNSVEYSLDDMFESVNQTKSKLLATDIGTNVDCWYESVGPF